MTEPQKYSPTTQEIMKANNPPPNVINVLQSLYKGGKVVDGYKIIDDAAVQYEDALALYTLVICRQPRVIVEAGTGDGLSTLAIGMAAKEIGADFYTIDVLDRQRTVNQINEKYGTDIAFMHGSSLEVTLPNNIDMFFHDSNHLDDYPTHEYDRVVLHFSMQHILVYHDTRLLTDGSVQRCIEYLCGPAGYDAVQLCGGRGLTVLSREV